MINDIITGAAANLKDLGMPIYTEEMPMAFSRPCFSIRCIGVSTEPFISGYMRESISLGVELYTERDEELSGTEYRGRNMRLGGLECRIHEALRFLDGGDRLYCARELTSERRSQVISGNVSSDAEGIGGILYFKAVYSRFVKTSAAETEENDVMNRLFEKCAACEP